MDLSARVTVASVKERKESRLMKVKKHVKKLFLRRGRMKVC